MSGDQTLLDAKLEEMAGLYGALLERLRRIARADRAELQGALERTKEEYRRCDQLLRRSAETGRSPAVAELAQIQLEYSRNMGQLLQGRLERDLHSEENTPGEDRSEAAALYAEYAIDSAGQAIRYALIAALTAMELQPAEESKGESICRK